jgi:hypothetical protein
MQRALLLAKRFLSNGRVSRFSSYRAVSTTTQCRWSGDGDGKEEQKVSPDSFQRAKRGAFFQPRPQLYNTFVEDVFLRQYLQRVMPVEVCEEVFADLERFGERVSGEIEPLGRQAELEPPSIRSHTLTH